MDIVRQGAGRKRMIRRIIYITAFVLALGGIWIAVARLKPAAPSVEAATLWPGTVKRGPMKRDVRGLGTLVPEEKLVVPAQTRAVSQSAFFCLEKTPRSSRIQCL